MSATGTPLPLSPSVGQPGPGRQGPPTAVNVRVETSFAALGDFQEEWDDAVGRLGGPVYMTLGWLQAWWDFYGQGKQLRLFLFYVGSEIVGLVPVYLDCLGLWPVRLIVARLVGASIPPKVFDPPVHPGWASECFESLLARLLKDDRCDVVSLGPVSDCSASWKRFPEVCAQLESLARCSSDKKDVYSFIPLPERNEDYLQSLGKSEQKRRNYELRSLQKQFALRVDVVSESESGLLQEFERFAEQHTMQWESEGMPGHFGAWPHGYSYNQALVKAQGRLGRVRFVRLWANDQVIASQYAFAFAGRWFWELPARVVGGSWKRYSLGSMGAVAMIGEAIGEGARQVEGGLGHYGYKLRLKAEEHSTSVFRIVSRGTSTRVRTWVFNALRLLLLYGYKKLWYRRVQPRLPVRWRSGQWPVWLRLDF